MLFLTRVLLDGYVYFLRNQYFIPITLSSMNAEFPDVIDPNQGEIRSCV